MSTQHPESKSQISDDQGFIELYQGLIRGLIPSKNESRLDQELDKFSSKLSSRLKNIIKTEVIRLMAQCDASADNSLFAKFTVQKFNHFDIPMKLDKVGQRILSRETKYFGNQYTVGVYESVMSSVHYQTEIRKAQQQQIVNVYKMASQPFKDIDFADDLAIWPDFKVSCREFEKGKDCTLISLSSKGMVLVTKRIPMVKPELENKKLFVFSFPKVDGMNNEPSKIKFEMLKSSFNKEISVFETNFHFAPDTPIELIESWNKYLENSVSQFSLRRDLEIQRIIQNLERDSIFANSPWIPVFLGQKDGQLLPLYELRTPKNAEYNKDFNVANNLPSKPILKNLIDELLNHKETFLLTGGIDVKENNVKVVATHRQLAKLGLINQFIELATQSTPLSVLQLRLQPIEEQDKSHTFDIHGMMADELSNLNLISHVLFCKDVTPCIGNLKVSKSEPLKPFPRAFIDDKLNYWPIQVIMESASDRRGESRYRMDTPAKVSTGLFSQFDATLNDLSTSGLKLTLHNPNELQLDDPLGTVKVSIKDINVVNQKYEIIHYNQSNGILRLNLPKAAEKTEGQKLQSLLSSNAQYFDPRDLGIKQPNIHHFLWELGIRNFPCAAILVIFDRFSFNRLKTVYHNVQCYDLKPFAAIDNKVPMHGFFTDKDSTDPKSELLDKMLRNNLRDANVVHIIRTKDQHIVNVKEKDFLFGKARNQISNQIAKKTVDVCVSDLSAIRCEDHKTPLTSRRLTQISTKDIDLFEKFKSFQKTYTHVIYLTNVSDFHSVLLSFGIYPEAQKSAE